MYPQRQHYHLPYMWEAGRGMPQIIQLGEASKNLLLLIVHYPSTLVQTFRTGVERLSSDFVGFVSW